eukprot:767271-Hanusia_phi.AAC.7
MGHDVSSTEHDSCAFCRSKSPPAGTSAHPQTPVNRQSTNSPSRFVPLTANAIKSFLGKSHETAKNSSQLPLKQLGNQLGLLPPMLPPPPALLTRVKEASSSSDVRAAPRWSARGFDVFLSACQGSSEVDLPARRYVDSHIRDYGRRGVCAKLVSEREVKVVRTCGGGETVLARRSTFRSSAPLLP